MARLLLLYVAALLCVSLPAISASVDKDFKWSMMNNLTGVWGVAIKATKTADKSVFVVQNCTESVPFTGAACLQPKLSSDRKDKVQVTITRKNMTVPIRTFKNLPPVKVFVNLCFSPNSTVDRPWRKFKDIVYKDKSCEFEVGHAAFDANQTSYTFTHEVQDTMPSATFFVRVAVKCDDGTEDGKWCQFDRTRGKADSKSGNYIETERIKSITPGMRVAVGIASAVGPAFLIGFFAVDYWNRRKSSSPAS